jgi:hypothetical protein
MKVRIRGGTVQHGEPSLCKTCRSSVEIKGPSLNDEIVLCRQIRSGQQQITFPVMSCTAYSDRTQPSLWHMEEIAWVLRSDPSRARIGFVQARRLKEDDRHVLEEE